MQPQSKWISVSVIVNESGALIISNQSIIEWMNASKCGSPFTWLIDSRPGTGAKLCASFFARLVCQSSCKWTTHSSYHSKCYCYYFWALASWRYELSQNTQTQTAPMPLQMLKSGTFILIVLASSWWPCLPSFCCVESNHRLCKQEKWSCHHFPMQRKIVTSNANHCFTCGEHKFVKRKAHGSWLARKGGRDNDIWSDGHWHDETCQFP